MAQGSLRPAASLTLRRQKMQTRQAQPAGWCLKRFGLRPRVRSILVPRVCPSCP